MASRSVMIYDQLAYVWRPHYYYTFNQVIINGAVMLLFSDVTLLTADQSNTQNLGLNHTFYTQSCK